MKTYVALLRGINVGGAGRLPMKELVEIFVALGHGNVRTYIQSGNVVFQSRTGDVAGIAARISREILDRKGFEPKVLIMTAEELGAAIAANPFPTNVGKALHLYFLTSEPSRPDLARLRSWQTGAEEFRLAADVFYLHAPDGVGNSKLAANVERALGVPATARNWNTVIRLAALTESV